MVALSPSQLSCGSAVCALLSCLLVACGGEDKGRPTAELVPASAEPSDPCAAAEGYEFTPILDFEENNDLPEMECDIAECQPYFSIDDDNTPGFSAGQHCPVDDRATIQPTANSEVRASFELPEPRCDDPSASALHIAASRLAACTHPMTGRLGWGASFQLAFTPALDASAWDGVSFWVRRGKPLTLGDSTSNRSLMVLAVDAATNGAPDPETMEACRTDECLPDGTGCIPDTLKCDPFGAPVTLSDEWTFVPLPFSKLRQKGFGLPSRAGALDTSGIVRLQFLITAGEWDFFIDDISLFRLPR